MHERSERIQMDSSISRYLTMPGDYLWREREAQMQSMIRDPKEASNLLATASALQHLIYRPFLSRSTNSKGDDNTDFYSDEISL